MKNIEIEKSKMDKMKGEVILSCIFILISCWIMIESVHMSLIVHERIGAEIYTLPGVFPFIIAFLIFFCSIFVIIHSFRSGFTVKSVVSVKIVELLKIHDFRVLTFVIIWMAIYIGVLIPFLPFEIATFLFVFVLFWIFKAMKIWKAILVSALFSIIVVSFFSIIVKTPFPHTFF